MIILKMQSVRVDIFMIQNTWLVGFKKTRKYLREGQACRKSKNSLRSKEWISR